MNYEANSIQNYLEQLPEERQDAMQHLLGLLRSKLPAGFHETMAYKMPSFVVPHSLYPAGYHCDPKQALPFISIASQKNHISVYHMGLYADQTLMDWFTNEWSKHSNRKPDMGKSCLRFKNPAHIPYELLGQLFEKMTPAAWINLYERSFKR